MKTKILLTVVLFCFALQKSFSQDIELKYYNNIENRHALNKRKLDSLNNVMSSIQIPYNSENLSKWNDLQKQRNNTVPINQEIDRLNTQYENLNDKWGYTITHYSDYDRKQAFADLQQMSSIETSLESKEFDMENVVFLAKEDEPVNFNDLQTKNLQKNLSDILAMNEDDGTKQFELSISLPFQGTPVYADNTSEITSNDGSGSVTNYSSKETAVNFFGLKVEPIFHIVNSDYMKLLIYGSASYSNTVIVGDVTGSDNTSAGGVTVNGGVTYYDYTYGGELDLGSKFIKILGEYEGGYRYVDYENGSSVSSIINSTITTSGTASYNFMRYGVGLNFRLNSDGNPEAYLKLKCFYDKPDYAQKVLGYALSFKYGLDVTLEYIPNYPTAGNYSYAVQNAGSNQSFWFVSIGKTIGF